MARTARIIDTAIIAALELAAETPWKDLTLARIAKKAAIPLEEFHGIATKDDLALAVSRFFDKVMSSEPVSMDEMPRERLFEVLMLRFEAMEEYRAGLLALNKHIEATPRLLVQVPLMLSKTSEWALVSAGLDDASGAPMGVKRLAIAAVIAQAHRAWRKETSGDFALTMAALDKGLREAEGRMDRVSRFMGRRRKSDDTPTDDNGADEPTDEINK